MKNLVALSCIFLIFSISCKDLEVDHRLWDKGEIPYKFIGFDARQAAAFYSATKIWNREVSCISFLNKTGEDTSKYDRVLYVTFVSNSDTSIGAISLTRSYFPEKDMFLIANTSCDLSDDLLLFSYCHELAHIIGFNSHEFQRPDRDVFLSINYNALSTMSLLYQSQFLYVEPKFYDYKNYKVFDYTSVTMYKKGFLDPFLNVPLPVEPSSVPSYWDAQKAKEMYNCE